MTVHGTMNIKFIRLCVTSCGTMHPQCCRPAILWVHYTTRRNTHSNAPEYGRNHRPKHAELIGIINKPLLLHLVVFYIIVSVMHGQANIKATILYSVTFFLKIFQIVRIFFY